MKEVKLFQVLEKGRVQCRICAHYCILGERKTGICGVHQNREGKLVSLVYGKTVALHVDPIEKKPLFHLFPGASALSIATVGCNMRCDNCQNADISQMPRDRRQIQGHDIMPEVIVDKAVRERCDVIAYTYTEPAVFWDYAFDISVIAHEKNILNVFVTNGYMSKESLAQIAPFLSGANVDLKTFQDDVYQKVCGARLAPVLETITRMRSLGLWVEVTTLLIPGLNDSEEELKQIAGFLVSVDPGIPWHISRFYPTYRMTNRPPTSAADVRKARQIGLDAGVQYVYTGNLPGDAGESTTCHRCQALLIHRTGYQIQENRLEAGCCPDCHEKIPGLWK
ncbi:AmmeMemoRadiSam system radical SAM enzyme [bacterium]|nr:AmmeMemoRadiSam system radical SAM enzyme [bacterium]